MDRIIADELKVASLKRFNQDASLIEKGQEFGIAFENYEGEIKN
jgi:translation initiation factor IF-2